MRFLLILAVMLAALACSGDSAGSNQGALGNLFSTEKCYHITTAEPLAEIRDAAGKHWKVSSIQWGKGEYAFIYCAVPMDAKLGKKVTTGVSWKMTTGPYLYLPDSDDPDLHWELGEPPQDWPAVEVTMTYRGMYVIDPFTYEWR